VGDLFAGVDLGTTGTKVTLLDPGRGVVAAASAPVPLHSDAPGSAEADPALWWENVCALVPRAADQAGVSTAEIAGVAASGMVPAVVVLDAGGRPLRRAILQNDARAVSEIAAQAATLEAGGYDMLARTGSALTQQSVSPTWAWLRHHEPQTTAGASAVVGSYDWLAVALGAPVHVESNWAIESGLYELDGSPAGAVRRAGGVPDSLCPPVQAPGDRVGEVSAAAARATGLRPGTPIYVGGADHVLAAYAAGLRRPGDVLVKLGGAGDILVVSDEAAIDARWYLDAHPAPGRWLPNGCMATSGSLLRWLQGIVGGVPLEQLDAEAADLDPAPLVCLPYFLGEKSPLNDPDLRGAFVGLELQHGRAHLHLACMEAVAYGFRNHVEVFAGAGLALRDFRVSNGGSGSKVWKQVIADVLGQELTSIAAQGGASLGAALVAAVGAGALPGWDGADAHLELGEVVRPRAERAGAYDEAYALYLDLQRNLAPVSHRLAARARPS
jgi:xylulokinase